MKKKVVVLGVVLMVSAGCLIYFSQRNQEEPKPLPKVVVLKEIKGYNYQLMENHSKLFQTLFKELNQCLKAQDIDDGVYASLVARLFIVDFFDLNSKMSKTDVGGLQFVHFDAKDNLELKAQDTIYQQIESNIYGDRVQELPIVISIDFLKVEPTIFKTDDLIDETAYEVLVKWEYKKDDGYQMEALVTLIHEEEKLSVVS